MKWRQINDYGIRIDNRIYDCAELGRYRRQPSGLAGKRGLWEVHYDPYDLAQVFVRNHHDGGWITVAWTHLPMVAAPFADFTWRHARRLVAESGREVTETDIARVLDNLLHPRRARPGHRRPEDRRPHPRRFGRPLGTDTRARRAGTGEANGGFPARHGRSDPVRCLRRRRRSRKVDMTGQPTDDGELTRRRATDHEGRLAPVRRLPPRSTHAARPGRGYGAVAARPRRPRRRAPRLPRAAACW